MALRPVGKAGKGRGGKGREGRPPPHPGVSCRRRRRAQGRARPRARRCKFFFLLSFMKIGPRRRGGTTRRSDAARRSRRSGPDGQGRAAFNEGPSRAGEQGAASRKDSRNCVRNPMELRWFSWKTASAVRRPGYSGRVIRLVALRLAPCFLVVPDANTSGRGSTLPRWDATSRDLL